MAWRRGCKGPTWRKIRDQALGELLEGDSGRMAGRWPSEFTAQPRGGEEANESAWP